MANRNTLLIILIILVIILALVGIMLGINFYRNKSGLETNKEIELLKLTLEDMYSNIKDSKKIVKTKITVTVNNKDTYKTLEENQFLIRDDINKIIRNKTEEDLQGEEGQIILQKQIQESLIELFNEQTIINVYFNDFIIQ